MALYDWTTAAQANVYTAAANRKHMAGQAARLVAGNQTASTDHSSGSAQPEAKR
jgi:hypothetical protein